MTEQFSNLAQSTLASGINSAATMLVVASASNFPALGAFHICVCASDYSNYEIMVCTSRIGSTLTVTRAQEGTSAISHLAGEIVANVLTAGVISSLIQSAKPGGDNYQIQYNNNGAFAGSSNLIYDGSDLSVETTQDHGIKLSDVAGNSGGLVINPSGAYSGGIAFQSTSGLTNGGFIRFSNDNGGEATFDLFGNGACSMNMVGVNGADGGSGFGFNAAYGGLQFLAGNLGTFRFNNLGNIQWNCGGNSGSPYSQVLDFDAGQCAWSIGDYSGVANGTLITLNDYTNSIRLNAAVTNARYIYNDSGTLLLEGLSGVEIADASNLFHLFWSINTDGSASFAGGLASIGSTGEIITTSDIKSSGGFIKPGGTSSQFLKADGTTDGNAYLPFKSKGVATLISGTKSITITGLTTSNQAFVQIVSPGGTLGTAYKAVCTSNTLTITAISTAGATITTDTSTLNYLTI